MGQVHMMPSLQKNYELFLTGAWDTAWLERTPSVENQMPPMSWLRREGRQSNPLRLPVHSPGANDAVSGYIWGHVHSS